MPTLTETPAAPSPMQEPVSLLPGKLSRARPLFDPEIVRRALKESFVKLNPLTLAKNPVMFVVEVGAALVTVFLLRDMFLRAGNVGFEIQISLWLWFTVLFANFAEAMAEARGKAQADTLRKTKTDAVAKRVGNNGKIQSVAASAAALGRYRDCGSRRSHPRRWGGHRRYRHC